MPRQVKSLNHHHQSVYVQPTVLIKSTCIMIMIYMTYGRFALCQFAPGRFPLISK